MKQIEDIRSLLDAMSNRGAEIKAFEGLLSEISQGLADIVALLEKSARSENSEAKSEMSAQALAQALADAMAKAPAAQVSVSVPDMPAPIVNMPAPDPWKALKVTIQRDQYGGGPMQSFTITRG